MKRQNMAIQLPDFCGEIAEIVRSNLAPTKMQEALCAYHENDIASALQLLSSEECLKLFRILPLRKIAEIFEHIEDAPKYYKLLGVRQRAVVLSDMDTAKAADLIEELSEDEARHIMQWISPNAREEISLISSFDDDEIGNKMSTNFVVISHTSTIKEAMNSLVEQASDNDNISMLYVAGKDGVFCGAIDLKDLIVARAQTPLEDIVKTSYPYLYSHAKVEDCVPVLRAYGAILVLDDDNKQVGVVTAQDFVEILDDEMADDYAKLAGLAENEDLNEGVFKSIKKRVPWLCILLALGFGVSATVGIFEGIVAKLPVIMCFQSMILDMAGNVGTQSLAVTIRALSEADGKQKRKLVWKEMRLGIINGCVLGVLSTLGVGAYLCIKGNAVSFAFAISGCLGIAMLVAMAISSLFGTIIPMLFKRIGIDPAVASGPLITTINDLIAVVSYYGLAWIVLINILHLAG